MVGAAAEVASATGAALLVLPVTRTYSTVSLVVVPAFYDAHPEPGGWQVLARWIDETLPYASLCFFPAYWAFNIQWHERPERRIDSYAEPKGRWEPADLRQS